MPCRLVVHCFVIVPSYLGYVVVRGGPGSLCASQMSQEIVPFSNHFRGALTYNSLLPQPSLAGSSCLIADIVASLALCVCALDRRRQSYRPAMPLEGSRLLLCGACRWCYLVKPVIAAKYTWISLSLVLLAEHALAGLPDEEGRLKGLIRALLTFACPGVLTLDAAVRPTVSPR